MPDPKNSPSTHVVGGRIDRTVSSPSPLLGKRIVKAKDLSVSTRSVVVGGDGPGDKVSLPAILIEKDDGRIVRISVKCPCGRNCELVLEEEPHDQN
ncbi:MAG: hypothetical protein RL095_823 [Verrucomicrobiota bacterium]|jgi:hypothetical protein